MSDEIHKGDIGTVIELVIEEDGTAVNISSATATKQIRIKKPSGKVVYWDASFSSDGTDGKLRYSTVGGDLDEPGEYIAQAYAVLSGWTGHSEKGRFTVLDVV